MNQAEREFLEELRRDFVPEAEEYLQTIVSGLLALEKSPASSSGVIEEVFRAAHSLKGAAQAVQMPGVSSICQVVESVFSGMKKGVLHLSEGDFDILQRAADTLSVMIGAPEKEDSSGVARLIREIESLLEPGDHAAPVKSPLLPGSRRLLVQEEDTEEKDAALSLSNRALPAHAVSPAATEEASPQPKEERPRQSAQETVRIAASKLDSLLLKAEELIAVNLALTVRLENIREILSLAAEFRSEWEKALDTVRRDDRIVEKLPPKLQDFLQSGRGIFRTLLETLRDMEKSLRSDQRAAGGLVRDLLEGARTVLMLPFSSLLQGFPKIVRDLGRELGKEVDVIVRGGEIEVDKRILEGLKDPLVHLVRNCVDHGLEKAEERRIAGKPPSGTITLTVSQSDGGRVEILVADDGKGIDPAKLREIAVKNGAISKEDAALLDDAGAMMLMFRSGVSTSPLITDISGRGLGMAIVQEGVEALGGSIALESKRGEGTSFRLSLPLTLATFRGVLVEEWGRVFVIPSSGVERVARVEKSRIKLIEQKESVSFNGAPLALARLGHILELPSPPERLKLRDTLPLVVIGAGGISAAFGVDRVLNEQEILLKPLGKQLARVRNVSGATVLGSGMVVPVLNTADLIRSVQRSGGGRRLFSEAEEKKARRNVLVAEDSITSRTLLRNILSAAGFDVQTAVDGQEAWDFLAKGEFHIVVSDVEMPRMNGFELTEKIRSDPATADLPVVLVTSLESREDRERGAEAGADAYIVKSGFDQGNLLDVLHRLL